VRLPPFKQPEAGDLVGEYRLVERLGDGGQGYVFKAGCGGRFYVLKFLHARVMEDCGLLEVSLLQKFRHPHIVRVHGYGRWPDPETGWFYLVMEWVEGVTLEEYAQEENPGARACARMVRAVAETLGAVHGRRVVHRDVKPGNILIRARDGAPVLVDFGLGEAAGLTPLPINGLLPPGTSEYVSPEAWRFLGERAGEAARYQATAADDVWALGVTLYWLLTDRLPFGTRRDAFMVREILAVTPKAPHECNPRVPRALGEVCMRMLEKEPAARLCTTQGVCAALDAALAGAEGDARWDVPLVDLEAPEWRETDRVPGLVERDEEEALLRACLAPPRRGERKKPPPVYAPGPEVEDAEVEAAGEEDEEEGDSPGLEVLGERMAALFPDRMWEVLPARAPEEGASAPAVVPEPPPPPRARPRRWVSRVLPTFMGTVPVRAVILDGLGRALPSLVVLAVGVAVGVGAVLAAVRGPGDESARAGVVTAGVGEEDATPQVSFPRELAVSPESSEAGGGAPPPRASTPAPVVSTTLSHKEESPVNTPEKSHPKAPRKTRRCVPVLKEVCVAGACTLVLTGCPGAEVREVRPVGPVRTEPRPAECPADAEDTMRRTLDIRPGESADATFPVVGSSQPVTVREYTPVKLNRPLGKLAPGTQLSGRLIFGQERVYGRFTQARTPGGETYTVCIELNSRRGERGVEVERDAGPDAVVVWSSQDVRAVRRFE
jgi:eukaryotic-like serine/threonine-protein kinase